MTDTLQDFALGRFTFDGRSRDVYRKGTGPGVLVIHELPGLTPRVADFGRRVAEAGFTAVLPSLVGTPGRAPSGRYEMSGVAAICVSREFATMAMGKPSPVVDWLRALARDVHDECGGPGVGAVGMCFSGGFALAMMVDDVLVAPVLSQPSMPFAIGKRRSADLGLSPADEARIRERAAAGCDVLGLRYRGDKMVGTRFDSLRELLGEHFLAVEFEGSDHSVLTEHLQETGVEAVISFLRERLLEPRPD